MTLVVLGLLLGMAGLLWMLVIAIMQADHRTNRKSPREANQPVVVPAHCRSKTA
ncbi:MAG: hypothetical protein OJF52_003766 [Nitrospira sp.]|jgi:Flp pilus assembly protein CpaB|nr:MAG: hypothetical protein OJF52_003766 [Nitrospira sp.]